MTGQISFVRNFRNGYGWEIASITDEENKTIQEALRKKNNQIYEECLKDAEKMVKKHVVSFTNPLREIRSAADKLFEKRAIHFMTTYQEFLRAEVEKLRRKKDIPHDEDWDGEMI